jgi:hypothetical protein
MAHLGRRINERVASRSGNGAEHAQFEDGSVSVAPRSGDLRAFSAAASLALKEPPAPGGTA